MCMYRKKFMNFIVNKNIYAKKAERGKKQKAFTLQSIYDQSVPELIDEKNWRHEKQEK